MMRDSIVDLLDHHLAEFGGPFTWGARDCVTFAAGWVKRVTGRDLVPADLTWSDKESATAAMKAMGCENARELAARFLPASALLSARVGDIVERETALGPTLGICVGADVAFIERKRGIVRIPLSRCGTCWRVD